MKIVKYLTLALMGLLFFGSCEDDDDGATPSSEDPIASFQFEADENDFLTVNFSNFSQNASNYAWDFGDGNSSVEENPTHTYAAAGEYEVTLTASNADGESASTTNTVIITDPNQAAALLTGGSSKTWKLYRVGSSLGVGPNADETRLYFALENDGSRPCVYRHTFTFTSDGSFVFDDMGEFWGEAALYDGTALFETCFEATASNMVNSEGADISAFLSGTHQFSYDPSAAEITLTGNGAWMGLPQLGTTGESLIPEDSKTFTATITEEVGYDLLHVAYDYGDLYWDFTYVNYSDPSLEPELETEEEPFGEDLPDISPTELSHTFSAADAATLLDTIASASTIIYGVDDPVDPMGDKVGQFNRTAAQFQELQFQTSPEKNDINFENLTTISLEVYLPSSNTYNTDGGLNRNVLIGFADVSQTEQWWMDLQEFSMGASDLPLDEWTTITFDLNSPDYVANPDNGATPYDRNDYDMLYINIGGTNHPEVGTFYVRNLIVD